MDIGDIVPNEQEMKDRLRRRHDRIAKMCEGKSARYKRRAFRMKCRRRAGYRNGSPPYAR